jgi:hypothetical protein
LSLIAFTVLVLDIIYSYQFKGSSITQVGEFVKRHRQCLPQSVTLS